jgi:hypothetical protein
LIGVARLTKARQQGDGNPSCLVKSKAIIATSLSKSDAALSLLTLDDTDLYGERKGAANLARAGLSPKAAETNVDKATSWLARPPARDSSLSLLEGGGGSCRLALAGRRPTTRCVPVHELVGQGDRLLGGRRRPRPMG